MLHFLRKHQKYFFFVITVVVIASFSFFGTYDTLAGNAIHEQVAFTALDGTKVTRGELEAMTVFISTDKDDKILFGGSWGPNFLNDGVIKNDIMSTGLAEILASAYPELINSDLASRLEKEKRFVLYSHPQAKFLSVESAWEYFAPAMKANFRALQRANNASSQDAISARIGLFLNERQFPSPLLRQVLRYQQKQQAWISPDPNLDYIDLSLFGYHTLEDWFGSHFLRIISEFIINSSKLAEQKGYEVSKTEALADLMRNAEVSFQQNLSNPHLNVANSAEYMNEQLRLLGMDRTKAARVWQQVLLFRRLFQDVGNTALVDALTHRQFADYAKETVTGDLYRLPPELRLRDYRSLQKMETYLYTVAKRARIDKMNEKELLSLPTSFLSVDEVKKRYPEMVQKKYVLEIQQANKNALQARIGLKEMWNWEAEDKNFDKLKKEFPELAAKPAKSRDERIALLDTMDDKTRSRIDAAARNAIVDEHPEWLETALDASEAKQMNIGIRPKGGTFFVVGLENREELINLLDKAPLNAPASGKLAQFSGNNSNYYRIKVIERQPGEEVLTFAEANREGVLDQLLDQMLEAHYQKVRDTNPGEYQNADKSWKPFAEVKDAVADQYFDKLLKAIQAEAKEEKKLTGDRSASLRLYAYMKEAQAKLQQGGQDAAALVRSKSEGTKPVLADQWKLEKSDYRIDRGSNSEGIDTAVIFAAPIDGWAAAQTPANGDISFFHVRSRESGSGDLTAYYDKMDQSHAILADDAQRNFMYRVVNLLKENKAISLDYLSAGEETIAPEN